MKRLVIGQFFMLLIRNTREKYPYHCIKDTESKIILRIKIKIQKQS